MIWEIDGTEVSVLPTETDGVVIVRWEADRKIIRIPAKISRDEATWIIRDLLHMAPQERNAPAESYLDLFGTKYAIRQQDNIMRPFIKDCVIYCNTGIKIWSVRVVQQVKNELLLQLVVREVGDWEDRLGVLVPKVALRANKKRPFKVCPEKRCIYFDRGLVRFSQYQIAYLVACAMLDFTSDGNQKIVSWLAKNYPDSKIINKIVAYEYGNQHTY